MDRGLNRPVVIGFRTHLVPPQKGVKRAGPPVAIKVEQGSTTDPQATPCYAIPFAERSPEEGSAKSFLS
ncbi:MAG: hypothetical protein H5T33_07505 [Candidatus Methanosuratus sp.]|nr:hypothetical protein [Candidatus Methanosuratincola sp.]